MVWNVVDGLRGAEGSRGDDSSDSEYTQTGGHSRETSFASSASGRGGELPLPAPKWQPRRKSQAPGARPQTNVSLHNRISFRRLMNSCTLPRQTTLPTSSTSSLAMAVAARVG
jgi:hypothetical protein